MRQKTDIKKSFEEHVIASQKIMWPFHPKLEDDLKDSWRYKRCGMLTVSCNHNFRSLLWKLKSSGLQSHQGPFVSWQPTARVKPSWFLSYQAPNFCYKKEAFSIAAYQVVHLKYKGHETGKRERSLNCGLTKENLYNLKYMFCKIAHLWSSLWATDLRVQYTTHHGLDISHTWAATCLHEMLVLRE